MHIAGSITNAQCSLNNPMHNEGSITIAQCIYGQAAIIEKLSLSKTVNCAISKLNLFLVDQDIFVMYMAVITRLLREARNSREDSGPAVEDSPTLTFDGIYQSMPSCLLLRVCCLSLIKFVARGISQGHLPRDLISEIVVLSSSPLAGFN